MTGQASTQPPASTGQSMGRMKHAPTHASKHRMHFRHSSYHV
eukprot:CAMPEP_0175767250 /NCGR_PEP_ID=MMETSP0097-20121207/69812_1 /TAXON_ID=311494 /ORGANISM="Alexandrium monilatum, Strain CCMP3105" /LENGTH=41 /DNA_ID= /DNA_START= /DNA_END= /DNA_ORIENTATION=